MTQPASAGDTAAVPPMRGFLFSPIGALRRRSALVALVMASLLSLAGCSPDTAQLASTLGDGGPNGGTDGGTPGADAPDTTTVSRDAGYDAPQRSDVVIPPDLDESLLESPDPTPVSPDDYTSDDPLEQFVLHYAVRFCNKIFECDQPRVTDYAYTNGLSSPAACMDYYVDRFSPQRLLAAQRDSRLNFNMAATQSCFEAIEQQECVAFGAMIRQLDEEFWLCRDVLQGAVAEEGECYASAECQSGQICAPTDVGAACAGRCQILELSCGSTTCSPFTEYCDYDSGTCNPHKQEGDSCERLGRCDWDLYCPFEQENSTCTALTSIDAADERCDEDADLCPTGTVCGPYYAAGPPVCRRLVESGGPCQPGTSLDGCNASSYCKLPEDDSEPTCVPRLGAGETCERGFQCVSGRCLEGACVAADSPCIVR